MIFIQPLFNYNLEQLTILSYSLGFITLFFLTILFVFLVNFVWSYDYAIWYILFVHIFSNFFALWICVTLGIFDINNNFYIMYYCEWELKNLILYITSLIDLYILYITFY